MPNDRLIVRVQWIEGNPTHQPCYGCGQKLVTRTWRLQFRVGRKSYPRKQPEIICDNCLAEYRAGITAETQSRGGAGAQPMGENET